MVSIAQGQSVAHKATTKDKLHGLSEKVHGKQVAYPSSPSEPFELTDTSDVEGVSGHKSGEI